MEAGRSSRIADRSWTPRTALARAGEVVRDQGVLSLWFKVLGETVYRRAVLVERPMSEPDPEVAPHPGVAVRRLDEADAEPYRRLRPDTRGSEFLARLQRGRLCFAVWLGDRIVSASWVAFGRARIEYLSRWLHLAPDEAFEYETFTAPQLRGRSLSSQRFPSLASHLRASGCSRLIGVIMPENRPAFRTQAKVGYRPFGTLGWIGLGSWRHHYMRLEPGARAPGTPAPRALEVEP